MRVLCEQAHRVAGGPEPIPEAVLLTVPVVPDVVPLQAKTADPALSIAAEGCCARAVPAPAGPAGAIAPENALVAIDIRPQAAAWRAEVQATCELLIPAPPRPGADAAPAPPSAAPQRWLETGDEAVAEVSRRLAAGAARGGAAPSPRHVYDYLLEHMFYPLDERGRPIGNPRPMGAAAAARAVLALQAEAGRDRRAIDRCFAGCDCTEFACLFVALCRRFGHQARVAHGLVNYIGEWLAHDWAQVLVADDGWATVDLNYAKSTGADAFGIEHGVYVVLHFGLVSSHLRVRRRAGARARVETLSTARVTATERVGGGGGA